MKLNQTRMISVENDDDDDDSEKDDDKVEDDNDELCVYKCIHVINYANICIKTCHLH